MLVKYYYYNLYNADWQFFRSGTIQDATKITRFRFYGISEDRSGKGSMIFLLVTFEIFT